MRKEEQVVDLFVNLHEMVGSIAGALTDAFSGISGIFYTPGVGGGLTIVGYLLIASLAVGLIKLALNLVVRLFTRVK